GLPGGVFGGEPGALPPADTGDTDRAGEEGDADFEGIPQFAVAAAVQGTARPDRDGNGAADEFRGGGRGDGGEGGTEVGLHEEGNCGREGRDYCVRGEFSRAHRDRGEFFERRGLSQRIWAVHPGIQDYSIWRRQCLARGDYAEHLRVPGGTDTGRGGNRDSA